MVLGVVFWRFLYNISMHVIHTLWAVRRGDISLDRTDLGHVANVPPHLPLFTRCSMHVTRIAWVLSRYLVYTVLGASGWALFTNSWTAFDSAKALALTEYTDAITGTANGKCTGILTSSQRHNCNEYEQTLAKVWPFVVWSHFIKTMPSCGFMHCHDAFVHLRDSTTALVLWMILMLALGVVVVRIVLIMMNMCTHSLNAERSDEDYRVQRRIHDRLPDATRHILDMAALAHPHGPSMYNTGPLVSELDDMEHAALIQTAPSATIRHRLPPPPPSRFSTLPTEAPFS